MNKLHFPKCSLPIYRQKYPMNWATTLLVVSTILLFTQPLPVRLRQTLIVFGFGGLSGEVLAETDAQTIDKIIAVVNDEVITQTDVNRVLAAIAAEYTSVYSSSPKELEQKLRQVRKNIINQMVKEKLILSAAKKFNLKIDEDRIEARIEQVKENSPGEEGFERVLEMQGLTLKDLRDRFRDQEIMKKAVDYFVKFKIKIDPIEIRLFFESQKAQLVQPEEVLVKSILIKVGGDQDEYKALQKAKTILERLRKGDNFAKLAKSYSQGALASEGGNLGFIEKGQLIEEIDEAIFSLKPGKFTDAIKTPQGYRIFKVEVKKPKRSLTFSEAQDIIRQILYKKKFAEVFKKWISELKEDAYISIKE